MPQVRDLFRDTLNEAINRVGIGFTLGFYSPEELTPTEKFIEEFGRSTRVANLIVETPDPSKIPDSFVYYNPQKERNEIIAGSHKHDYPNSKKVDLEATSTGDIKRTHMEKI
jgi:hypothetical protein